MIKFEHNMLVLNNTFSDNDVREINAFAEYVRKQERERILARLEEWKTDDCGNCPRCAANREIIWIIEEENK